MKMKKRLLSILLSLVLMLGLLPGMSLTAYAAKEPTYKIEIYDINYGETQTLASTATLPYQTTGSKLKQIHGYMNTNVDSITIVSGDNISVSGTSITITDEGTSKIMMLNGSSRSDFNIIVTSNLKNISATATGYDGPYDGKDHAVSVNVSDPNSGATVEYGTQSGTYNLTESPKYKDAGNYTVYYQITADDYKTKTGSVVIKIDKVDPTANGPSGLSATYGQTLADVTLTNPEGNTPGTWAWVDNTQSVGNVVSPAATFKANFTPTDTTNYNAVENVDVTVNVNKADAVAATVTANNRTYDGTEKPLVTVTGTASSGEMQYALGTATEATQPYTTSIPTATNAGTYYVWYKVVGDDNHLDSAASCVAASIASVDSGSDDPKKGELVYSGSAQKLVKGGSAVGGTMKYALGSNASTAPQKGWSANVPQGTNAGTYYVWYRVDGDQNHNSTKPACVTVTIRKAPAPKTLSDKQKAAALARVYNGKAQTLVKAPAALPTGYTKAQYSTDGGKTWSAVLPKGTKAGSYTVRVKYVGDKNHTDFTYGPLSAPIAKAKITIAAQDKKTTRGDALAKLTYMVSGAYVSGDSLGIKVSTTAKKAAKAGKYPINVSWNGNKNYSATLQKGTYTLGDAILPAEKKEARNLMDAGLRVDWDSSGVLVRWGGAPDAESYEVWAGYCGKDSAVKKVSTLGAGERSFRITSLYRKELDPGKFIRVTVRAFRNVGGKKTEIMHTIHAHVAINTNPRYTNTAQVTLPGTRFILNAGRTAKIKAVEVPADKKKRAVSEVHTPHFRFRYESTKPSVASVDENGTVTAVGRGTCTVYVYALNCRYGKVTVTVR